MQGFNSWGAQQLLMQNIMFDCYYCIKTQCDAQNLEIWEENATMSLLSVANNPWKWHVDCMCFETPLPGHIPTSCWLHIFTFATVPISDADITFCEGQFANS